MTDAKFEQSLTDWLIESEADKKLPAYRDFSQLRLIKKLTVREYLQSEAGKKYIQGLVSEANESCAKLAESLIWFDEPCIGPDDAPAFIAKAIRERNT